MLAYTRFPTVKKLVGDAGLCPSVDQSGGHDWGALAKNGPKYLRWALIEASIHSSGTRSTSPVAPAGATATALAA